MAGVKRKITYESRTQPGITAKKHRKDENGHEPSNPTQLLEAETDSDPIIESDTTSQSGDDDGSSWPSDNDGVADEEDGEEWEGSSEDPDEEGGIGIPADSATQKLSNPKPSSVTVTGTKVSSAREASS